MDHWDARTGIGLSGLPFELDLGQLSLMKCLGHSLYLQKLGVGWYSIWSDLKEYLLTVLRCRVVIETEDDIIILINLIIYL